MTRILIGCLLAVSLVSVSACGFRSAKSSSTVNTTTTGQQLIDLKTALDDGAITESEYEKKRKEILKAKG